MATPTVNFLSYNSTGINSIKTSWIRDLCKVTNTNFLGIQEHFKSTKSVDKFFKEQFPTMFPFTIPAVRNENQDSGRARGGLSQLLNKSLNIRSDRIKTENFRLQAQILHFPTTRILWVNSYFPNDPLTILFDDTELMDVLNELENILDSSDFDDLIWQGDLNWDMGRASGFSSCMKQFMERLGLVSVWEHHPVSYTHIHTDLTSTSTLDHFVVNERLLSVIADAGVLHLGDNLSRHSPIMLKLNLGSLPVQSKTSTKSTRRPAWYKAEQSHMDEFTRSVDDKLSSLQVPETLRCSDPHCQDRHHTQERDNFVLDVMCSVIETSHQCIPMSGGRKTSKPECPVERAIPGWKDMVEPYKVDAAFWHGVWQSADRPSRGVLKDIMTRTRNQYHYAVRRLKKMSSSLRARKLLQASETGSCELLKEMKKIKGGKKESNDLPDSVGGASGEHSIVEEFRKVYFALYNSSDTSEDMAVLKEELKTLITGTREADLITGKAVKEAATRMKPKKSDISGSYTSEAILNAPDIFFDHLALVYRSWLLHGTVTLSLLSCAFLPLFKGGLKDPSKTDSYRAIAGSSLLLKLFDNVILLLWGDVLGTDSLQFGFKSGTSTTECTWMVMEVASYFLRRGVPCVVTLLDCSKAFDMCQFSVLFQKLKKKGLPAIVIRTLIFVYEEQTAWVSWGTARSSQFGILNGTRQGSVLSPGFFGIYVDELLLQLRRSGVGCYIGGSFFGAAGYADDIILLAPCRSAMAQMVKICEDYGKKNNLMFSTDSNPAKSKTKCLYMCGPKVKNPVYPAPIQLYGVDLPWVTHATHLGHELSQDCTMTMDTKMKRANYIKNSMDTREMFGFALPDQVLNAISVYSAHFYGSNLWDLYGDMAGQVYRSWSTTVKLVWDLPRSTHNYFVDNMLAESIPSARKRILCQYVSFLQRLGKSVSKEVRLMSMIAGADVRSVVGRNVLNLRTEFKLDPWRDSARLFQKEYKHHEVPAIDKWRLPFLRQLLETRYEMKVCEENDETISGLIDSLCSS